jgi:hypothetical protein
MERCDDLPVMNHFQHIDAQSETSVLAKTTTEELPGYAEWCDEVDASNGGLAWLDRMAEDSGLDASYESRTDLGDF